MAESQLHGESFVRFPYAVPEAFDADRALRFPYTHSDFERGEPGGIRAGAWTALQKVGYW